MNGCVIPQTPIAVDIWKIRYCPQARIFFLTHLHGDHVTGLTSSWCYPIYCSEITGKLLVQRYGVREDLIRVLQVDSAQIIYLDSEYKEQMTVTALDANHCPGALMFLMQGYFGTILHTGDFRYHKDMISNSVLSSYSGKIDTLYLDNTYCSPGCIFPTREETTAKIIEIIENHPTDDVLIAMRNLGKEDLLCKVALHFHEWITVPEKFYKTLDILGTPDVFDCSGTAHRIRVVPFQQVSNRFVERVNAERSTIVILPTALYHGIDATPYENNEKVFIVPYSDHSSYNELREFVSCLKPKEIIPIVKGSARGPFGLNIANRADMSCFAEYTTGNDEWMSKIDIPKSVQAFMLCKNNTQLSNKGLKRKSNTVTGSGQVVRKKSQRGITYNSPKCEVYLSVSGKKNVNPSSQDMQVIKAETNFTTKRQLFVQKGGNAKHSGNIEEIADTQSRTTQNNKTEAEKGTFIESKQSDSVSVKSHTKDIQTIMVGDIEYKQSDIVSDKSPAKDTLTIMVKDIESKQSDNVKSPAKVTGTVMIEENDELSDDDIQYVVSIPTNLAKPDTCRNFDDIFGTKTYSKSSKIVSAKRVHVKNEDINRSKENQNDTDTLPKGNEGSYPNSQETRASQNVKKGDKNSKLSLRCIEDTHRDQFAEMKNQTEARSRQIEEKELTGETNIMKRDAKKHKIQLSTKHKTSKQTNAPNLKQLTLTGFLSPTDMKNKENKMIETDKVCESGDLEENKEIYTATKLCPSTESTLDHWEERQSSVSQVTDEEECVDGADSVSFHTVQVNCKEAAVKDTICSDLETEKSEVENLINSDTKLHAVTDQEKMEIEKIEEVISTRIQSSEESVSLLHSKCDSKPSKCAKSIEEEEIYGEEVECSLLANMGTQIVINDADVNSQSQSDNGDVIEIESERTADIIDLADEKSPENSNANTEQHRNDVKLNKSEGKLQNVSVLAVQGTQNVDNLFEGDSDESIVEINTASSNESTVEMSTSSNSKKSNSKPAVTKLQKNDNKFKNVSVLAVQGTQNVDQLFEGDSDESIIETNTSSNSNKRNPKLAKTIIQVLDERQSESRTRKCNSYREYCRKCEMEAFERTFAYFEKVRVKKR